MGAFHDFVVVVARRQEPKPKSSRGRYGAYPAPRLAHGGQAEDRWYDEGGNTQTRVAAELLVDPP